MTARDFMLMAAAEARVLRARSEALDQALAADDLADARARARDLRECTVNFEKKTRGQLRAEYA